MSRLLDAIQSPADLKQIPVGDLPVLAQEIRDTLITTLAKTGGHLGPNLGVVELSIAWHYVFNSPADRLLMDVSHQAYVHKLLTGRATRIGTMRQYGGLNGFMLRTESEHDHYGAGHAGTALSAALGMAVGRDKRGGEEHITALCGDAAFTCGITFEAMNNVASQTKRLIVVLNDNEWSIDKNVGSIANYLNKIVTSPTYAHLHESAARFIERLGGQKARKFARKVEEGIKGLAWPSTLFEEFGFTYYGPMDGHDLPMLIQTFEFLKEQNQPVLLHVLTKKGKGFGPAEQAQAKFHGLGPYDPESGETAPGGQATYSEILGDTLSRFADTNRKLIAITGAMPTGTGLSRFQPKHPEQYVDVGIAEEHAVLFAAGLATQGFKPFVCIYSTFLQRAIDCIIHDVALQNLPVVFCMDRAGLSGDDGPTHHGLFDIAYLRGVPNLVHMQPRDEDEFVDMLWTAMHHAGPVAVRYPRGAGTGVKPKAQPRLLDIGKAEVLRHGTRVVIFALGALVPMALEAAERLEAQGVSTAVVNARFIKPLDTGTLEFFARSADVVCTMEDHVLMNGFGSGVLEALNDLGLQRPVVRIGWPDQFIEHGKVDILREKAGISVEATVTRVTAALGTGRRGAAPVASGKLGS
jgi:1-deoxy-D-xylulose-5-phosphate synthase